MALHDRIMTLKQHPYFDDESIAAILDVDLSDLEHALGDPSFEPPSPGGSGVQGYPPAPGDNAFAQGGLSGTGAITASSFASFAQGYAENGAITSSGGGSFAQGYVQVSGAITASSYASFAQGYAGLAGGAITSSSGGSFAQGYALGNAITSEARGSFAQGFASNATDSAITSSGGGSFAQGYAGNAITSSGSGSFAQGVASSGAIMASGYGSFAQGYSKHDAITSSGNGSFAQGYATAAGPIAATADNAVQFGPGTNAQADSLQIGSAGVRLLGIVGPPTTPQNGDIWVDGSGNVIVRTNGASKNLSNVT